MKLRGPEKGQGGSLGDVGGCREPYGAARGHRGLSGTAVHCLLAFGAQFFSMKLLYVAFTIFLFLL
jgi:hypothetical protein